MIKYITILLLLILAGCASKQTHFIVAPITNNNLSVVYQQQSVQMKVTDLRNYQHLMAVHHTNNEQVELFSSQQSLSEIVQQTMQQALLQQGLKVTKNQGKQVQITIEQAEVKVEQSLTQYQANWHIQLAVTIKKEDQILTKRFSRTGNNNGPFSADISVMERDFNQGMADLLQQLVTDSQVISFIQ